MGDKLRTMIRCNVGQDSMFGKDMEYEQLCELRGSDGIVCWNEYGLLCKLVYNNENGCVTGRLWKFLNEIHRNGIPKLLGNQKLLQGAIGFVPGSLGSGTSGTWLAKVNDKGSEPRPGVLVTNECDGLVLPQNVQLGYDCAYIKVPADGGHQNWAHKYNCPCIIDFQN